MKSNLISIFILCYSSMLFSQNNFTRKDSLQGGFNNARICFDVKHYELNIKVNPEEKSIVGYNEIQFEILENTSEIQLDLFQNMNIDSIIYKKNRLNYKREFNAVFIDFPSELKPKSEQSLKFYYSGKPIIAKNAPWEGGFVFKKDSNNKPWIGVACQGTGASLWYPVKDSQSDEPDFGATIKVAVPDGLINVSNGKLIGNENLKNGYTRWDWQVKSPINTYAITLNIADYIHIHENYKDVDLDYYVLRENEHKAKTHFKDVIPMMDCFQSKFGPYPFINDGYKLIETPYLGMEHQSAVAYGNQYLNGYLGSDLSETGLGLRFDYIIIHESGHEWFGNSITSKDIADMWLHEGFTTYTECVFVECLYGYEKGQEYVNGLKNRIENDQPIIGFYGVNNEGSSDMYSKGALLINTIRHIIQDESKWAYILLKYAETYRHKIIDTEITINFFNFETGLDLTPIFNQYLRHPKIPILNFKRINGMLHYRWNVDEPKFNMPVDITLNGSKKRLYPTQIWTKANFNVKSSKEIKVCLNDFYIDSNWL